MEKELVDKIQNQIALESDTNLIKEEIKQSNERTFWKYLDYSNWIPGEIEAEEEIKKYFD